MVALQEESNCNPVKANNVKFLCQPLSLFPADLLDLPVSSLCSVLSLLSIWVTVEMLGSSVDVMYDFYVRDTGRFSCSFTVSMLL